MTTEPSPRDDRDTLPPEGSTPEIPPPAMLPSDVEPGTTQDVEQVALPVDVQATLAASQAIHVAITGLETTAKKRDEDLRTFVQSIFDGFSKSISDDIEKIRVELAGERADRIAADAALAERFNRSELARSSMPVISVALSMVALAVVLLLVFHQLK